ncbi:cyclin-dependent kinase inhibitor 3 [Hyalella azteca]|uniref:protein-tyrosine-phosphatase n=1 Tax=Hyalella azteca TaxID=294128 RepID=A0A8B7NSP3_HYAAZ|nr:cyclin-dependent kinase inhibitor 3 [Hyalella azteca]
MANAFDSSDEEDRFAENDIQTLKVDRLVLPHNIFADKGAVYLSGLPGCWFRNTHHLLQKDIDLLVQLGVTDAIVLLSKGELRKYRSPSLLSVYLKHNIQVHYHPFEDGSAPSIDLAMNILDKVFDLLQNGGRILIHCMSGVGRTGTIAACLLQWLDEDLSPDASVVAVRSIRGNHAVHSVKQYNFVMEFRERLAQERERSVSR